MQNLKKKKGKKITAPAQQKGDTPKKVKYIYISEEAPRLDHPFNRSHPHAPPASSGRRVSRRSGGVTIAPRRQQAAVFVVQPVAILVGVFVIPYVLKVLVHHLRGAPLRSHAKDFSWNSGGGGVRRQAPQYHRSGRYLKRSKTLVFFFCVHHSKAG